MAGEDRPITSSGNNTSVTIALPPDTMRDGKPDYGDHSVSSRDMSGTEYGPYKTIFIVGPREISEIRRQGDGFVWHIPPETFFSVKIE